MGNVQAINASVSETFHAEPEKSKEFDNIINDFHNRIIDEASAITRTAQLMEGHRNLLLGLRDLFPQADITIPPEAEELTMSDSMAFLNNVKVRFQIVDTHVYNSVLKELKMFKEGKKSPEKVKEEVLDLIYYHEDLTEQFLIFFP